MNQPPQAINDVRDTMWTNRNPQSTPRLMRRCLIGVMVIAGLLARATMMSGHDFAVNGSSSNGGSGTGTAGRFKLSGAIGQPAAGSCTAGDYVLQGGFVPGLIKPVGPPLNITRAGNQFTFTWPNLCTGFVLESASSVNGPVWTSLGSGTMVGANWRVTVSAPSMPAFFRLRKNCPARCSSNCAR
jgi:hypothetical protein